MSKYFQKTWTITDDTETELALVAQHLASMTGDAPNQSAALRYCVKQAVKQLQKEAS